MPNEIQELAAGAAKDLIETFAIVVKKSHANQDWGHALQVVEMMRALIELWLQRLNSRRIECGNLPTILEEYVSQLKVAENAYRKIAK